jgi:predicted protein tyrosine phosphatase
MLVPFRTTVCGIDELEEHSAVGVTHVLSILDPATPEPPAFAQFSAHAKIELRFDDVIEEIPDKVVPRRQHVTEILALGRDLLAEPADVAHLLVHCHAGVSRSTASMLLILAQACPERSGVELMGEILRIRSKAWPNLRIVEFGDALLGRRGELVAAVPIAYRTQLERRPELQRYFVESGRAREVQKAGLVL